MAINRFVLGGFCAAMLALSGCSRQQSDWQKARETNTTDAYEQFVKKYPSGEFTAQAEARAKELYEERDWQKARDTDTPEAYQAFLKQYPDGKWTEEARIRVENFTLAQAPSNASPSAASTDATNASDASGGSAPNPAAPHEAPVAAKAKKTTAADAASATATAATPVAPAAKSAASPQVASKAPSKGTGATESGHYGIQFGAYKSGEDAAHRHWADLQKEYPTVLAGLSPHVIKSKTATATLYRLQSTGLSEKRARTVCEHLKAKSQSCVLIPPAGA